MTAALFLGVAAAPLMADTPERVAMRGVQDQADGADQRWYSEVQVARGAEVYARNCAACHGSRAQGGSAGGREAPALNGAGHSAHHGLDYLLSQVAEGGVPRGGVMPAFADLLDEAERRAAIAWVQSLWPDAVYRNWHRSQDHHHR